MAVGVAGDFVTGGVERLDFRFGGIDAQVTVAAGEAGRNKIGAARAVFFQNGRAGMGGGGRGIIEADGQEGAGQACIMAVKTGRARIDHAGEAAAQFAIKRAVGYVDFRHQTTCA